MEQPMTADKRTRTRINKAFREKGLAAKVCRDCSAVKGHAAFSRSNTPDGRAIRCRDCQREVDAAWYAENAERKRSYSRQWHRDNRDRNNARARQWHRDNRERAAEIRQRFRVNNPDYWSEWARKNPDKVALTRSKRRAAKNGSDHQPYVRSEIFNRWTDRCCYCDDPATELDHVNPVSRGGSDAPHNLVPACLPCNRSKGAKSLAEWAVTFNV